MCHTCFCLSSMCHTSPYASLYVSHVHAPESTPLRMCHTLTPGTRCLRALRSLCVTHSILFPLTLQCDTHSAPGRASLGSQPHAPPTPPQAGVTLSLGEAQAPRRGSPPHERRRERRRGRSPPTSGSGNFHKLLKVSASAAEACLCKLRPPSEARPERSEAQGRLRLP